MIADSNTDDALTLAFGAVTTVARVLRDAIGHNQNFTVDMRAGTRELLPVNNYASCEHDGSYEIHIIVKPKATDNLQTATQS